MFVFMDSQVVLISKPLQSDTDEQMDYETNLTRKKRGKSISRPQGRDTFPKEEEGVALTRFVFRNRYCRPERT